MSDVTDDLEEIDVAKELLNEGDFDGAVAIYSKLLGKYPYAVFYFERGTAYLEKSDFQLAIGDLTKAIDLTDDDPDAYTNRGNAHLYLGNLDAAINDFEKVIEMLSPTLAHAYNGRAVAYRKMGRIP